MNYGKQVIFSGIKRVVTEERNLQQHRATAAEMLFVFRGNYIQGVT